MSELRITDLQVPMTLGEKDRLGFPFVAGGNLAEGDTAIPPQSVTVRNQSTGADVTAQMTVNGSQQFADGVLSVMVQAAAVGVYLVKYSTATNQEKVVDEYLRFRVVDPNAH